MYKQILMLIKIRNLNLCIHFLCFILAFFKIESIYEKVVPRSDVNVDNKFYYIKLMISNSTLVFLLGLNGQNLSDISFQSM